MSGGDKCCEKITESNETEWCEVVRLHASSGTAGEADVRGSEQELKESKEQPCGKFEEEQPRQRAVQVQTEESGFGKTTEAVGEEAKRRMSESGGER